MSDPLLSVQNLFVRLPRGMDRRYATQNVSFDVFPDEVVCVVGESGSGKSVVAQTVMGLLPSALTVDSGTLAFQGADLLRMNPEQRRTLRGSRMAMIFQEPMSALNPVMTIGEQIAEVFRYHGRADGNLRKRVVELIDSVGLPTPDQMYDVYPHRLSGGQRQRVVIAIALALEPDLLIADEPTTALDVTTQAQILRLISDLQKTRKMGVMFITHDFGVVADVADRIVVMQHGEIVEQGRTEQILRQPAHPYTRKLIDSVPTFGKAVAPSGDETTVLSVENLRKTYLTAGGLFKARREVHAVKDVSFSIRRGETLGLVGGSGSGKSTVGRCIVRLIEPNGGRIVIDGREISQLSPHQMRPYRSLVQMVFQDPFASLNPRRHVGDIIGAGLKAAGMPAKEIAERVARLLPLVGLTPQAAERFPHEFSGGQRQRIGIARALALEPKLLIADEPVSALDVSIQAQVLDLLRDLRDKLGLSMLFVTHDLRVASEICDRVAVMQLGEIVEIGSTKEVFTNPQHAYTRSLIDAVPGKQFFMPALNASGSVSPESSPV
jgi:peptide/nickel transport system ATP-binding protein